MDKLNNSLMGVANRIGGLVASAREQALQNNDISSWQSLPWEQLPYYSALIGSNAMIDSAREANEMNIQLAKDTMAFNEKQAQKQMDFQERMSNTSHQREMADLRAAGLNPILAATNGASVPSGASAAGVSARVEPTIRSNPYEDIVQSTYMAKKYNEIEKKQMQLNEKYYDVELKKLRMAEIQLDDSLKTSASAREVNRSNISRNAVLNALTQEQIKKGLTDNMFYDLILSKLFPFLDSATDFLFSGGSSNGDYSISNYDTKFIPGTSSSTKSIIEAMQEALRKREWNLKSSGGGTR